VPKPQHNTTGQVYRCLICGAEVSVVRNADGALEPHCCNQPMTLMPQRNPTYFCEVCGSEVMAIRTGPGHLTPHCCNQPMALRKTAA